MNKYLALLLTLSFALPLCAQPRHPKQLSQPVKRLYQLEETRRLIAAVEHEGAITIQPTNFGFDSTNAAWVPSERTIYLNYAKPRSEASLICSIVFELHNALSGKQFSYQDYLARTGQISKAGYIEATERIEYANAQKTAHILQKGVRKGIFPHDATWGIAPNFEEHYRVQIRAGHSDLIGYIYDDIIRTAGRSNGNLAAQTR